MSSLSLTNMYSLIFLWLAEKMGFLKNGLANIWASSDLQGFKHIRVISFDKVKSYLDRDIVKACSNAGQQVLKGNLANFLI